MGKTLDIRQSYFAVAAVGAPALATSGSLTCMFSQLPDFASYQTVFDQYRINRLTFHFEPCYSKNDVNGVINAGPVFSMTPILNRYTTCCIDYDDDMPVASEAEILQYNTMSRHPSCGDAWTVSFEPRFKMDTGAGLDDVVVKPTWIDLDNVSVKHYGMKYYIPVCNFLQNFEVLRVVCTVDFSVRNSV